MQPVEVQQILQNPDPVVAKPSPAEHATTPTSPAHSYSSSGRASLQSPGRATSSATDSTPTLRPNRFSLSFPVQPSALDSPTRTSSSPTRDAPAVVPGALASPTGPTDTSFLTAIATQERRVLELKEELQRAEADLNGLKKQWAQHEANKKRNDVRRITKLQPLQTAVPVGDETAGAEDADGSNVWMQAEIERRKALIGGRERSNRTVFSGSRHTRTLSLLSPGGEECRTPQRQALPPRKDSLSTNTAKRSAEEGPASRQLHARPGPVTRVSTTPDFTTEVAQTASPNVDLPDNLDKAAEQEDLLRTGKKFANDFRDGLWTFFEDLRQATVGEEAAAGAGQPIQPPNMRRQGSQATTLSARTASRQPSKDSIASSSRASNAAGSKANIEIRRPSPNQSRTKHVKSATQGALPDLADPSFWTAEHGALAASPAPLTKKSPSVRGHQKNVSKVSSVAESDSWEAWDDSLKASRSSSVVSDAHTLPSSISGAASPRPSAELRTPEEKKDPIPWPALNKLGPATLRRTASHLMNEWEKSLTPSPGTEYTGQGDYLGLGAEAAATQVNRKKD